MYVITKNGDKNHQLVAFNWKEKPFVKKLWKPAEFSSDKIFVFGRKGADYCLSSEAERYIQTVKQFIEDESPRYEQQFAGSSALLRQIANELKVVSL